jgi:L-methionine (R)-S-oxide reductase
MHDPFRATPWTAGREAGGQVALYRSLAEELDALLVGETDPVANAANAAAAIFYSLPELNWAGFYFLRGAELVLGPFQGQPACVRIPLGKGVCGTAAAERRSMLVRDVHEFPGHIACDANSRSELVVPLLIEDGPTMLGSSGAGQSEPAVLGVLDLDSPRPGRFDAVDQAGCEALAAILVRHLAPR